MLSRAAAALFATFVVVLGVPGVATADVNDPGGGSYGYVQCPPGADCTIHVGTPGSGGDEAESADSSGRAAPRGSGSGASTCRNNLGQVAPCSDPELGQITSAGCYRKELPVPGSLPSGGSLYAHMCATPSGVYDALPPIWVPNTTAPPAAPPAGAGPVLPAPIVLAAEAARRLPLPAPDIHANPVPDQQVVGVPVWVWISPSSWASHSATASVPGRSVTASATAVSVTWRWGDGTTLVCHGPGTPWRPGYDPAASSPTCGHTYRASSAGQENDAYPVSATTTWSVTWAGGGQSGAFPALTRTSSTAFRVAEIQALNVAPTR